MLRLWLKEGAAEGTKVIDSYNALGSYRANLRKNGIAESNVASDIASAALPFDIARRINPTPSAA